MNNDIIQGKWKQLSGNMQKQWGKLTNDDLDVVDGSREYLVGKIQERYGIAMQTVQKGAEQYVIKGKDAFEKIAQMINDIT